MDWDDLKPKPKKGVTLGEDLTTLSVAELEARIGELQQEIERVKVELGAKKAHEAAAAADLQTLSDWLSPPRPTEQEAHLIASHKSMTIAAIAAAVLLLLTLVAAYTQRGKQDQPRSPRETRSVHSAPVETGRCAISHARFGGRSAQTRQGDAGRRAELRRRRDR